MAFTFSELMSEKGTEENYKILRQVS